LEFVDPLRDVKDEVAFGIRANVLRRSILHDAMQNTMQMLV
jgi:hypothetical protein